MSTSLDRMKKRLTFYGETKDDRINTNKLRSMQWALEHSYQAEWITFNNQRCRCLINPIGQTEDYDDKMISIEFKYNLNIGDIFYWNRDNSYWITTLKERTEEAYFRAHIKKCNFEVEINGIKYWVYLRGPNEQTLDWKLDHKISYNDLNYSLVMYIQKNENTLAALNRFFKIKINGNNFQVAATDKYSMDAIIQVYLAEDFNNTIEDQKKEEDKVKQEQQQKEQSAAEQEMYPETKQAIDIEISGPTTVHAYDTNVNYKANNLKINKKYTWATSSEKAQIIDFSRETVTLNILYKKANTFSLYLLEDGIKIKDIPIIVKSI